MTALLTLVKGVLVEQDVIVRVHVGVPFTLGELSWLDLSRTEGRFSCPYYLSASHAIGSGEQR